MYILTLWFALVVTAEAAATGFTAVSISRAVCSALWWGHTVGVVPEVLDALGALVSLSTASVASAW